MKHASFSSPAGRRLFFPLLAACLIFGMGGALSGITIPSDGSDGEFAPVANTVIDLSLAPTASWDTPGGGNGVYDPAQWAVVFKFTSINIPAGVTVTFVNHPSRAPVIWMAQGEVTINGTVVLDGSTGHNTGDVRTFAEPGPGGFRGGRGSDAQTLGAAGMGPGGAGYTSGTNGAGSGGGYATDGVTVSGGGAGGKAYGNPGVFPLIGGSGGAGNAQGSSGRGGGAGGGAILVATPGLFTMNGGIRANGGNSTSLSATSQRLAGAGAGGGIRLIADTLQGNGTLRALGGTGGTGSTFSTNGGNGSVGRIRVEAFTNELTDLGSPAYSFGVPEETPRIFRDPATPAIRSVSLNGQAVPDDPRGEMSFPFTDVTLEDPGMATLVIEAENVPLDGEVTVRVVRRSGLNEDFVAEMSDGTLESSTWSAEVNIGGGFSTVQVHASFPDSE